MLLFAWYDYYTDRQLQGKSQPQKLDAMDDRCSDIGLKMSPNRFFAAEVIAFIISLTWLDFATGLTVLVMFNVALWVADKWCCSDDSNQPTFLPAWADVARNYAPLLLLVWLMRSFIIQPYHVPTGSLEPSLLPHELILVKQFQYGLRFPAWPFFTPNILPVGTPHRGDIALFRYPENEHILLIKRVVGLPGDHIEYKNKQLFVNGKLCAQQRVPLEMSLAIDHVPHRMHQDMYWENLIGAKNHLIYQSPDKAMRAPRTEWDVPQGMYFMMGDNRDNSHDSRFWGFVPEKNLIGKAWRVIFSWDINHHIRWGRLGSPL